jgi:hypothetical protein
VAKSLDLLFHSIALEDASLDLDLALYEILDRFLLSEKLRIEMHFLCETPCVQ